MRIVRVASAAVVATVAWTLLQPPAAAGGSHIEWDRYAYEPGDVAVADQPYSPGCCDRGTPADGPYDVFVYDPAGDWWEGRPPRDTWIQVGRIEFHEGAQSRTYLRIDFTVPDLDPGEYVVTHCNEGCATQLGDLMDTPIRVVDSAGEGRLLRKLDRLESRSNTTIGRLRARLRSTRADLTTLEVRIGRLEERDQHHERKVQRLEARIDRLQDEEQDGGDGMTLSFLGGGALIAGAVAAFFRALLPRRWLTSERGSRSREDRDALGR